mmetsp:Transcript_1608/g.2362  ORF Transcript_1608/g.2362 Transcript_1608/m.2362 type:complete len:133 (-) Transcript_1608:531-929(-)
MSSSGARVVVTQGARTRRGSNKLKNVPSMAEFVHKRTVVRQYRHYLKCIHRIPDHDYQESARNEVQKRFRQLVSETDALTIKMALQEGHRRLAQVQSMVGYTPQATDDDSWINTKDEADPRGRVGVSWPWQK